MRNQRSFGIVLLVLFLLTVNLSGLDFSFSVTCDQRNFAGPGKYDNSDYFRGACEAIRDIGGTSFMISPGDIDRVEDVAWTISEVFGDDYQWYPVVGNHELPDDGYENYRGENMIFLRNHDRGTVNPGPENSETTTYSFDRGDVHFIVLNEYADEHSDCATYGRINDHIYNWLEADLNANTKPYVIISGHEPAFPQPDRDNGRMRHEKDCLNQYPSDRDRFWNLLSRNNVVAYLCGHTHNYSTVNINGVWQIDAGHARGLGDTGAKSTFLIIEVTDGQILLNTYRKEPDDDTFTLNHTLDLTSKKRILDVRVNASANDAEERENGSVNLNSTDLEFTYDADANSNQTVGIRFKGITIPQGSVIENAYVQFTVDETKNEVAVLSITGHDTDDAPSFKEEYRNISARSKTSETVEWNPPVWENVGDKGDAQRTPELKRIIQEIVDRPGWSDGNDIALLFNGRGVKCAKSFDLDSSAAPVLHIEFTPPEGNSIDVRVNSSNDDAEEGSDGSMVLDSSDLEFTFDDYHDTVQTIGIKFDNLNIPENAVITNAYVQFTVDELKNEPGTLFIRGHDTGDAPEFTSSNGNITQRERTSALVEWSPREWTEVDAAGQAQRTPDLKTVIQEIVSRSNWAEGNSLALLINGTGIKCARSYDVDSSKAPLLHVEYTISEDLSLRVKVSTGDDDAEEAENGEMNLNSSDLEFTYDDYRSSNQVVGIRFNTISIPPGAVIKSAYIQFTVDENSDTKNQDGTLQIAGHDTDNAPAFDTSAFNITERPTTEAVVSWNPPEWRTTGAAGSDQRTPDLKEVVQEIISRPGWKTGNSIAITIEGSGVRCAKSYNVDAYAAPVLHIIYSVE